MVTEEQFIADYAPYIDKWGLVQPEPGTTSDNGIRFTSEAILAARYNFGLDPQISISAWINDRLVAIEKCQRTPGNLQRYPGCNTQEGFDDYHAAVCVTHLYHRPFALNTFLHGLDHAGIYKSTPSSSLWTLEGNPFLWRSPGLRTQMKHCAPEPLNCIDISIMKFAINSSAKSDQQDHKILTWFIIESLGGRYKTLKPNIDNWWAKLREQYGSIGDVLGKYYHPEHYNHPNSKYLMEVK